MPTSFPSLLKPKTLNHRENDRQKLVEALQKDNDLTKRENAELKRANSELEAKLNLVLERLERLETNRK